MTLQNVAAGRITHRRRRLATQDVLQESSIVTTSHNSGNVPAIKKKKGRTNTKLKRPPNGVLIPIEPESDW
jgi:hypothetical protein